MPELETYPAGNVSLTGSYEPADPDTTASVTIDDGCQFIADGVSVSISRYRFVGTGPLDCYVGRGRRLRFHGL